MPSSTGARGALVAALQADLVGPFSGAADSAEELPLAPSRWYLTGFLAPRTDRETKDPTADDDFGGATDEEDENEPAPEPEPKQRSTFPASLGMSVLLPAGGETIDATVSFAEYLKEDREAGDQAEPKKKQQRSVWRRLPGRRAR